MAIVDKRPSRQTVNLVIAGSNPVDRLFVLPSEFGFRDRRRATVPRPQLRDGLVPDRVILGPFPNVRWLKHWPSVGETGGRFGAAASVPCLFSLRCKRLVLELAYEH